MIRVLTDNLLEQVEAYLGNEIRITLSPSAVALTSDAFAKLPSLVFQGPVLGDGRMDYEVVSDALPEVDGVRKYGQKRWRVIHTLEYRVRFFHDSLIKSLPWVERLSWLSGIVVSVSYGAVSCAVEFDNDFDSDTVPNFSDLKHFESEARILNVPIRPDAFDEEVFGLLNSQFSLNVS